MRALTLGVGAAFALAGAAAAQPAVLVPGKPIHGTAPSFKADLPSKITGWEKKQIDLQFEEPTTLYDLEVAMLMALEPDLQSLARHEHLSFEEVRVLVLYDVVTGAAKKLDKTVHERREYVDAHKIPDRQDVQLRALERRKEALLAEIQELGPRMTPNTRLLSEGTPDNEMLNLGAKGK
jgi:hypothetical protein